MKKGHLVLPAIIACAAVFPAAARTEGPTFDCARAQGEVEKLICADLAPSAVSGTAK